MKGTSVYMGAKAAAVLFVAILLLSSLPLYNASADGVVTIYNAPPTFVSVNIQDVESRIVMSIEVSDYNGWEDIYRIYINVTDVYGNIIESAMYTQYPTNDSDERIDEFRDLKGGVLIPSESDVERFPYSPPAGGGWGEDWFNATLQRVTFVFKPFSGYRIMVKVLDRKMVSNEYVGPFTSSYRIPPVVDNPTIPISISLIVALVVGALIFTHRKGSNKLARLVEEKLGG